MTDPQARFAEYRGEFLRAITPKDIYAMTRALVKAAIAGDENAIRCALPLLQWCVGKPTVKLEDSEGARELRFEFTEVEKEP